MAFISPRMSLKVWNSGSDPYSHEQLADNFLKLDQHDHSQGRGVQIGGSGIRSGSITGSHFALGTVTGDVMAANSILSSHIVNGTLQGEDIGSDTVTLANLVEAVQQALCPTASIIATAAAAAPDGWLICDGATPLIVDYPDLADELGTTYGGNGTTTFGVPNMKGKTAVGRDAAQTEFDTLGESGGSKTHTLVTGELASHSHTVGTLGTSAGGSHTHTASLPTEIGGGHAHSPIDPSWDFVTSFGGNVSGISMTIGSGVNVASISGGAPQWQELATTDVQGAHAHTAAGTTDSGGSHSHTVTGSTATNGSGTAHNNLQPYLTLNYIIKT